MWVLLIDKCNANAFNDDSSHLIYFCLNSHRKQLLYASALTQDHMIRELTKMGHFFARLAVFPLRGESPTDSIKHFTKARPGLIRTR